MGTSDGQISFISTPACTYRSVLDPVVFDAPCKPRRSRLAGAEFAGVRRTVDGFSDHGALFGQGRELDVVGRPGEEGEGPAFVVRLLLWGRPEGWRAVLVATLCAGRQ